MRITIFGATGETGRQLVQQALAAGHEVVAYIRNPSKLNIDHEHLKVIQGELADETLIESAVSGADAVISALGPRGGSKDKPITQGMQNIIAAMKKQGVRRLIITSTLSAKDPNDPLNFKTKALVNLVKLTMHGAYEDIVSAAETVRNSDLDWTIVRLTMLNNNPKSGKVKTGNVSAGEVGTWISRADVADFMLKQVEHTEYLRQAPAISN
ncbi:MAG: SDR family oxidoreductase [Nitrososphaeria archaeon]